MFTGLVESVRAEGENTMPHGSVNTPVHGGLQPFPNKLIMKDIAIECKTI